MKEDFCETMQRYLGIDIHLQEGYVPDEESTRCIPALLANLQSCSVDLSARQDTACPNDIIVTTNANHSIWQDKNSAQFMLDLFEAGVFFTLTVRIPNVFIECQSDKEKGWPEHIIPSSPEEH